MQIWDQQNMDSCVILCLLNLCLLNQLFLNASHTTFKFILWLNKFV